MKVDREFVSNVAEAAGSEPVPLSTGNPIRVLAFVEANQLTGPAKNLIQFAQLAARPSGEMRQAEILVATFARGHMDRTPFTQACEDAGLKVFAIRERFRFDPGVVFAIRDLVGSLNPDIVQTHSLKSHFLMRLSGSHQKTRWLAFHHGYTRTDRKVELYNRLDRWSLPAAHHIVTVCRPFASEMERIGIPAERITIRHNAVAPFTPVPHEQVVALRNSLSIPLDATVLVTVGRLSREKGHMDLIRAFAEVCKSKSALRLRLVIAGDGPERPLIHAEAADLGVAGSVVFVGHQRQIAPFYAMADLVVLPSHSEGSPNALLEAMAAGVPVIATAVGGVPEITVSEQSALLVESRNPVTLAGAISRMIEDDGLRRRIAAGGRKTALDNSPARYCGAVLSLYDQLLAESCREKMV